MYPYIHSSTIYNNQDMKTIKVSTDRWMDKECVVHIYNGMLLTHKKEWNNVSCSNIDATRDYHTKWIHSEKDWQSPYDFVYVWNLWNRLTDIKNRFVVATGAGVGEGMEREFRLSRWKLLCIEWIKHKVLLYHTGNYIQYPMINHNGKQYFKNVYIYVCISESLCCIAKINTILWVNYTSVIKTKNLKVHGKRNGQNTSTEVFSKRHTGGQ